MPLSTIIFILITYILILLAIAFYTLLERKILGYFQLRKGPNKVRLTGLPQPLADALKLFAKELISPSLANLLPFFAAPIAGLLLALLIWSLYPTTTPTFFIPLGVLLFLRISSLNVYTTLSAGWTSNSKYALLGALRAVAQTISYEVRISLLLITTLFLPLTLDFSHLVSSTTLPALLLLPTVALIWFISTLAETNRTPFDFAEGESELVSGFNTEFRGGRFALIFIAEYINILIIRLLTAALFISLPFNPRQDISLSLKTLLLSALFIWVRATYPRIRYDRLIALTWKTFLPLTLTAITLTSATILTLYLF